VLGDLYEFGKVALHTYNTALNNLIWGKSPGNLETRAKTADQPGKVYKTVHPMTKRRTVREGQYLVQASSKLIKWLYRPHCEMVSCNAAYESASAPESHFFVDSPSF
jgi:hypothetical protein